MFGGVSDVPARRQTFQQTDHLWADRPALGTAEERRRKQQAYAAELRAQIEERQQIRQSQRARVEEVQSRSLAPYRPTVPSNRISAQTLQPPVRTQFDFNDTYIPKTDFSRTVSISPPRNSQFAETLRAQIDERRKASHSSFATTQPLSTPQPPLTFPGGSSFENAGFEMPAHLTHIKPTADHQRVRAISMVGAASMRSSIEQTQMQAPVIKMESPLDHSKISTPAAGFSVRGTYGRTSLPEAPAPFYPVNYESISEQLMNDSRMVYPDGHQSPV